MLVVVLTATWTGTRPPGGRGQESWHQSPAAKPDTHLLVTTAHPTHPCYMTRSVQEPPTIHTCTCVYMIHVYISYK